MHVRGKHTSRVGRKSELILLIVLRMVSFVEWSSSARPCPLMRTFSYSVATGTDPAVGEGTASRVAKRCPEPASVSEARHGSKEQTPVRGMLGVVETRPPGGMSLKMPVSTTIQNKLFFSPGKCIYEKGFFCS